MRKYSSITPKFWIGRTGRKLRGDISAKLVAAYLLSCPNNDMTGVFYCPLCQISAETGLPLEAPSVPLPSPFQGPLKGIREALETLEREDFAIYDYESEYVFVKKMALFQIAPELKPTDKRVTGIRTAIESMPDNFKHLFIKEYNECFNLGFKDIPSPEIQEFGVQTQEEEELPSSPIEAPSKALRCQEQDQEREQHSRNLRSPSRKHLNFIFVNRVSLIEGQFAVSKAREKDQLGSRKCVRMFVKRSTLIITNDGSSGKHHFCSLLLGRSLMS